VIAISFFIGYRVGGGMDRYIADKFDIAKQPSMDI
jgi:hypothetical protein